MEIESEAKKAKKEKKSKKKHAKHTKKDKNAVQTDTNAPSSEEAKKIIEKADSGIKNLEQDDASLSDMLSFKKEIATGKTADEEAKEAKEKEEEEVRQQILAQQAKKEAEAKANEPTEFEIEEAEKRQRAIDVTERKMLAQKYEQMMIEDEKKEGLDNGGSSF